MLIEGTIDAMPAKTAEPVPVAVNGLHGWFTRGTSRRGVLFCGTFGFEQVCAHRSWRALDRMVSEAGCMTLRFDYPGYGDSADAESIDVPVALAAIRQGIAVLREAGAEEIVLVGLRFGASLAALAACEGGVDRLALIAPFATGKAYLRELSLQARVLVAGPDAAAQRQGTGSRMVGSFAFAADTLASFATVNLLAETRRPAPQVLIVGPKADSIAEHFRLLGSRVDTAPFPELAQLVSDPLFGRLPEATFATIRDFGCAGLARDPVSPAPAPEPCRIWGEDWVEETTRFGPDLCGVLCQPRAARADGPAVVFVNSGRNVRSGQGRQTTRLARRLAERGVASLRFDPRGIGDSADRPDDALPVYTADAVPEVQAALDRMAGATSGPIVLMGSCSGAYLAFRTLCRDERPRAALMVNTYCFDIPDGTDIEALIRDSFDRGGTYTGRVMQGRFWRRLLSGEIRLSRIAGVVRRDVTEWLVYQKARITGRDPGGETGARRVAQVRREVDQMRRRGARLRLVYSAGDQGIPALHAHFGRSPSRQARQLGYPAAVLEGADHDLSMPGDQDRLFATLMETIADAGASAQPEREARRPAQRSIAMDLAPKMSLLG